MLLDVASLVASFDLAPTLGPLVVRRAGASSLNTFHEFVGGEAAELEVSSWTVHTSDGTAVEQVPEADRSLEHVEVYGVGFLFELGDRFDYSGSTWRVNHRDDYMVQGGGSFAMAAKEDPE